MLYTVTDNQITKRIFNEGKETEKKMENIYKSRNIYINQ